MDTQTKTADPRIDLVRVWFRKNGGDKVYFQSPNSRQWAEEFINARSCKRIQWGYDELPKAREAIRE